MTAERLPIAPTTPSDAIRVDLRDAGSGPRFLDRGSLAALIDALRADGRTLIGPVVEDGVIGLGPIETVEELPIGRSAEAVPGGYRLGTGDGDRAFGYAVGPTSAKRWTFPPAVPLLRARRDAAGQTSFEAVEPDAGPVAFIGLRPCDLAALAVQDRVLLGGPFVDDDYRARRRDQLIVAVECSVAQSTCFCTSMDTGPDARAGFDLALTELDDGFVVRIGSPRGAALLEQVPTRAATDEERETARRAVADTAASIGNPISTEGLAERLIASHDSPRWAEIAERCLSCANCTLVCPTCFCTSVVQRSDLAGTDSVSERTWDSCFNPGFAKVAGGSFRSRPQDRYRQWLTHKFGTWVEQFGSFGCVGCGRCIAWCPVGIDVRAELAAIAPPLERMLPRTLPAAIAGSPARMSVARLRERRQETADVATLVLDGSDALLATRPGQFVMVELPAFPPLPISVSRVRPDSIELTIR
ncbi:MAG TPA: 4Fe-4S dicluster domain-containing protein, partial [Candidatus Limnocylindrales bacterium]|nr:4Fe-4S dicluster domain-containing protein [Candidatus Limnocylindrales bacterium]